MTGDPLRLVVGLTGATGSVFGIRLLQVLQGSGVETHLVISRWAARTLLHETSFTLAQVRGLATRAYADQDLDAPLLRGSFASAGMVVAPCSVRTLSAIAHRRADNLIHRAAEAALAERRRLVLLVREAPLSDIHLENMLALARRGAVIAPPVPAFFAHPKTLDDLVDQTVRGVLDLLDLRLDTVRRARAGKR